MRAFFCLPVSQSKLCHMTKRGGQPSPTNCRRSTLAFLRQDQYLRSEFVLEHIRFIVYDNIRLNEYVSHWDTLTGAIARASLWTGGRCLRGLT